MDARFFYRMWGEGRIKVKKPLILQLSPRMANLGEGMS